MSRWQERIAYAHADRWRASEFARIRAAASSAAAVARSKFRSSNRILAASRRSSDRPRSTSEFLLAYSWMSASGSSIGGRTGFGDGAAATASSLGRTSS